MHAPRFALKICRICFGLVLPLASLMADQTPRMAPNASCKVVNPRGYHAVMATKAPVIDGKLDDEAWQNTAWTEEFGDIQGEARPAPRFRTRAKMTWDDQYFYVGARLEEPHVWGTLTQHDSVIFQDNDFEIFIDPDGDNHEYLELEINALNTEWDLRLVKPYRDGGPALNEWEVPGLKTAVAIEGTLNDPTDLDTAWTVEWAIPWKALGEFAGRRTPPHPGDTWRVNFSRVEWRHTVNKDGKYQKIKGFPEENWVWSPQGKIDMHRPELWGHVRFVASADQAKGPVVAEDQAARWFLLEVYDAQKSYFGKAKKFAGSLKELGIDQPSEKGWDFSIQTPPDGSDYKARLSMAREVKKPLVLEMHRDSKIVRTPHWDEDSK